MIDGCGRTIDYLRISVTDKCNLRCRYCMPPEGVKLMSHDELLSLEEISRLVRIMAGLGLKKVRLTGGEPLVRKNIEKLIADIRDIPQIEDIAITTNGTLLAGRTAYLKECGLTAVNISLDSLEPDVFKHITGADMLDKVLTSIDEVLENGMKCKLNCVPCAELNENSLIDMASIARDRNVDVRYIELMPIGCGKDFTGIGSDEILKHLSKVYGTPVCIENDSDIQGPAQYWQFQGFKGKIGFISPITHRFCESCNRIRLTAEGRIKLCLNYNYGIDLRGLLRSGASDSEIEDTIKEALKHKPMRHDFNHADTASVNENDGYGYEEKKMVQIGG
jgi:cyclic pyranopterin phosphate synthase